MSLTLERVIYPLNELVLVPVNKLKIDGNCRYGWDRERILPAYEKGLSELIDSISLWGFYPDKPILFYTEKDEETGEETPIIEDGRRRALAALNIFAEDETFVFVEGEQPGLIWGIRINKPDTIEQQLVAQSSRNTGLPNTHLDIAKMCYILSQQDKYKELKTKKAVAIGKALGLGDNGQVDQGINNRVNTYLRMWDALPDSVKDWIQEGELEAIEEGFPKLSWWQATLTVSEYEKNAKKVLSEVLSRCQSNLAEVEKAKGISIRTGNIRGEYIDFVAAELGIIGKSAKKAEKEKKGKESKSTPVNPPADSAVEPAGLPSERYSQSEAEEPDNEEESIASIVGTPSESSTTTKESPERLGAQILKLLKSKVGLILTEFEHNVTDDCYQSQQGLDADEKAEFESFLELVGKYLDGNGGNTIPAQVSTPINLTANDALDGMEF